MTPDDNMPPALHAGDSDRKAIAMRRSAPFAWPDPVKVIDVASIHGYDCDWTLNDV